MSKILDCPRCESRAFEKLETYAHCLECLYFEDYWSSFDSDLVQVLEKEVEEFLGPGSKPSFGKRTGAINGK